MFATIMGAKVGRISRGDRHLSYGIRYPQAPVPMTTIPMTTKDIISYLKRGYSVRNVAKLTNKGISTVQRIKTEFNL